jgi:hypothetical protein
MFWLKLALKSVLLLILFIILINVHESLIGTDKMNEYIETKKYPKIVQFYCAGIIVTGILTVISTIITIITF